MGAREPKPGTRKNQHNGAVGHRTDCTRSGFQSPQLRAQPWRADGKAPSRSQKAPIPQDADSIVKHVLADLDRARGLAIDEKIR